MDNNLSKHTDKNTPLFVLHNDIYICKIVNIINPNTIKIVFKPNEIYMKFIIKLNNISLYNDNMTNNKALEYLYNLLTGYSDYKNMKDVLNNNNILCDIKVLYFDKNYNLICELYKNNKRVSQIMLESNLVKKYEKYEK
tara:strand:- start:2176 stop:2592 length:417 start_codon:yes stop_codon:yes gene_type:complete